MPSIQDNIAAVRERIARAAGRAGRDPDEIELLAVSKTMPLEVVAEGYRAGLRLFGENRIQEGAAKVERAEGLAEARWHFIGHLQKNKINKLLPHVHLIQTVDSAGLADALDKRAESGVDVLVQVNVGAEPQKSGVPVADAVRFAREHFSVVRVRTDTRNADFFYRGLGFTRIPPPEDATLQLPLSGRTLG